LKPLAKQVGDEFGRLDVTWVNNAGDSQQEGCKPKGTQVETTSEHECDWGGRAGLRGIQTACYCSRREHNYLLHIGSGLGSLAMGSGCVGSLHYNVPGQRAYGMKQGRAELCLQIQDSKGAGESTGVKVLLSSLSWSCQVEPSRGTKADEEIFSAGVGRAGDPEFLGTDDPEHL
jgi:hypothetical protein